MSFNGRGPDVLRTVSRRRDVVASLADRPRPGRALAEDLECSRSTVDRAVRELQELGLVERSEDEVGLTVAGRLALEEFRRGANVLTTIADASHLLEDIPRDAPLSPRVLEGATIYEAEPHAPNEPVEAIADALLEADRLRCLCEFERTPTFRDLLYRRTVEGDLDAEGVLSDELARFLLESIPERLRDVIVHGDFEMYTHSSIPFDLVLLETGGEPRTFLIVGDGGRGGVRAVVRNDSQQAYEWGIDVYRQCRSGATKLSPAE